MTCFYCPRPATTTLFSDYVDEVMPACDPCALLYFEEEEAPASGHINDGYEDIHLWFVWE
jgi:hypothetical protein